ncbi:MAG: 4'-phosphopantetheinyl transferase superfamily protein, partial [Nocardioidaceae bacterium]
MSLSHSGGWIAVAACETGRIGIDVEVLRDVTPSLERRCLSAVELAWLDRAQPGVPRSLRFSRLWTAKEAYLKATGVGLAADPRTVSIDHTGDEPRLLDL